MDNGQTRIKGGNTTWTMAKKEEDVSRTLHVYKNVAEAEVMDQNILVVTVSTHVFFLLFLLLFFVASVVYVLFLFFCICCCCI